MEYRKLPDGTSISTIGIGVGNYAYENVPGEEIERIFSLAFDRGVNFFDTCMSASYPAEAIAKAIKGKRERLVMQNHLCVSYPDGEYQHTTKLSEVKDAFAVELEKYGTDYSDIGILHFVDEDKDIDRMVENGLVDYALSLKKAGIIRNVGFSSHTTAVARKMLDVANFDVLFFGVNIGYDYEPASNGGLRLSEERKELYQTCAKRGIAITVMKPFGNGQLLDDRTSPFGKALHPHQCLQYVLDRPAVVSSLCGALTTEEMAGSLRFYEASAAERDYSSVAAMQTMDMAGGCTYCNHCAPCPAGIHIGQVNKYYDLAKVGDRLAVEHYRALEKHADHCQDCGLCSQRCPFHV
ncbi:MAG: aldo/keto reductase, partial [Selenomonadaceae bacterium]|nr:aldo/keto reductase [Selenomonadaceae bacterium]